jgi:hypothetical protein
MSWSTLVSASTALIFLWQASLNLASYLAVPAALGYDARMYALAARAMAEGQDPWSVTLNGGGFAGPPTSLLPFLPFAWLPEQLTAGIWIVGSLVLGFRLLRILHLPPWWIAFPPLFAPVMTGGVEVLMVTLLTASGPIGGLAAVIKPYAALPLFAERRYPAIALGATIGVASFVVLPWAAFFRSMPTIRTRFETQTFGDNAFGDPFVIAIAIVALALLGWRRALWYAFPVLSPYSQPYYGLMTLPVIAPIVAIAWSLPIPEPIVVGVVTLAVAERLHRRHRVIATFVAHGQPAASQGPPRRHVEPLPGDPR